jgi:AcrR family transcriptional regulator
MAKQAVRRRGDTEETRRRVLDAVVATVVDVGYYKASSNEIARRAGVTWGTIQHLFGSREQLMLDVVNDFGERISRGFASSVIEGDTLEARLESLFAVLAKFYEQNTYLVQVQILLDLSANPKMSAHGRRAVRRNTTKVFDSHARPLLARALGQISAEHDLALYAFLTLRGYLVSHAISRHIAELPAGIVTRLAITEGEDGGGEESVDDLLVQGVAAVVRAHAERRGYDVDVAVRKPAPEAG